jgi:hypothetical protein
MDKYKIIVPDELTPEGLKGVEWVHVQREYCDMNGEKICYVKPVNGGRTEPIKADYLRKDESDVVDHILSCYEGVSNA